MSKSEKKMLVEQLCHRCSWCGSRIQDKKPEMIVLKNSEDITPKTNWVNIENQLSGYLGLGIVLTIRHLEEDILAYVFTYHSEEFESGYDLGFLLCDEECERELNKAFKKEDVYFDEPRLFHKLERVYFEKFVM